MAERRIFPGRVGSGVRSWFRVSPRSRTPRFPGQIAFGKMAPNWRRSALCDPLRLFGACFLDMREAPCQGGLLPNVGVVANIGQMVCGKLGDSAGGGLPETPGVIRTWRCWGPCEKFALRAKRMPCRLAMWKSFERFCGLPCHACNFEACSYKLQPKLHALAPTQETTHRGARARDHKVKSLALCRLR